MGSASTIAADVRGRGGSAADGTAFLADVLIPVAGLAALVRGPRFLLSRVMPPGAGMLTGGVALWVLWLLTPHALVRVLDPMLAVLFS